MPPASATTGPENPLKVYSDSEKAQIAQAAEASKAAYDAWKDAKARRESKDHVDDLLDKAMQASEVEKGLQDLCD